MQRTGKVVTPTGREFEFKPTVWGGEHKWPRTKILNYPVQGTGADLVAIGRVTLFKRAHRNGINACWQSTVHDSIDIDIDGDIEKVYNMCQLVRESIEDIPINFQRLFGIKFNLPVRCEISYGPNLGDLTPWPTKL